MLSVLRSVAVLAAAAATAAAVVACGAPAPAPAARHLVLGEPDAGRVIAVHPGDTVELVLFEPRDASGPSNLWTAASSAPSVVRLTSTDRHGPSTGSYSIADFTAERSGSARLTASPSSTCAAGRSACGPLTFPVIVR